MHFHDVTTIVLMGAGRFQEKGCFGNEYTLSILFESYNQRKVLHDYAGRIRRRMAPNSFYCKRSTLKYVGASECLAIKVT